MRTRTSWRNQERLHRALGGPPTAAHGREVRPLDTCAPCWALRYHSKPRPSDCPRCAKIRADRARVAAHFNQEPTT